MATTQPKPKMLYLIGVPGAGKTTVLRSALASLPYKPLTQPAGVKRCVYANGLVLLGMWRDDFSGTDALPMNALYPVVEWLRTVRPSRVVGEGDRLGNRVFFNAARQMGYDLTVALLDCSEALARRRCEERGSHQNETWWKGRLTKVANLRDEATLILPAERPVCELARRLRGHPALEGF